jgi:hypothetical protein
MANPRPRGKARSCPLRAEAGPSRYRIPPSSRITLESKGTMYLEQIPPSAQPPTSHGAVVTICCGSHKSQLLFRSVLPPLLCVGPRGRAPWPVVLRFYAPATELLQPPSPIAACLTPHPSIDPRSSVLPSATSVLWPRFASFWALRCSSCACLHPEASQQSASSSPPRLLLGAGLDHPEDPSKRLCDLPSHHNKYASQRSR